MDRGAWWAIAHGVPKSRTGKQPGVGRHLRVLRNFRLQAFNNTNSPLEILWSWKSLSSSQMKREKSKNIPSVFIFISPTVFPDLQISTYHVNLE